GTTVFLTTHYIEEAEALCKRVGIIHHGKLISIGSPLNLRRKLGLITVETNENGHIRYDYFPDREAASRFIRELKISDKVVMRQSNLEDVFIELTGEKVAAV
ncbi:MAG: ABC transporter ATP-binding protein, partial [Methanotrichaceae archaeon]|nr:ABC transporter ATP-binding protein [Methanotrichaceae archaeon]